MTRSLAGLVALCVALLAPSSASADWLPAQDVGTIGPSDQSIRMASNDRGDTVVVWGHGDGFRVSISKRGRPFGKPLTVPGSDGAAIPDVDVNEDGRAILWWPEFVSPGVVRFELVGLKLDRGAFGRPRFVTPPSDYATFEPVIGPGGRFAFVYTAGQRDRPVYARVAPPSGKLGPRITLATGSIQPLQLYYVGSRPMVAYRQASEDLGRIREREVGGGGGSRVIATVPENGAVVMDTASNGMQAALWTGGHPEGPKRPIVAATRRPGGVFGTGQELQERIPPQEIAVAVSRGGAAIVAWREWNEPGTEDLPSPTPEYTPGTIVYSYKPAGARFAGRGTFRPEEARTLIEYLSADISSSGVAMLGFQATTFAGIQRRLHAATIFEGDPPVVTPMTDYNDGFYRLHRVEIDERNRSAFAWIDERKVVARRGRWAVTQP
jgi:hypothetical protein